MDNRREPKVVTILEGNDWEAVYLCDRLLASAHSVIGHPQVITGIATALGGTVRWLRLSEAWLEEGNGFPVRLQDLPSEATEVMEAAKPGEHTAPEIAAFRIIPLRRFDRWERDHIHGWIQAQSTRWPNPWGLLPGQRSGTPVSLMTALSWRTAFAV
jgi:hypothetical protein